MCFIEKLKKFCLFTLIGKNDIIEHIDKIEEHYKDIKTDLEKIQKSIDPMSKLLLEMETYFRKRKMRIK